ncbi:hypothetical protein MMC12_008049 [Toensbergia leucococca]|nr:hypothetical protein [Toensbergia leucococca]
MAKKVAYAVFEGKKQGVYNTWIETEEQIKNYPKAHFRGYTVAEGGRDAAERAYEAHVGSKQLESADSSSQGDANKKPNKGDEVTNEYTDNLYDPSVGLEKDFRDVPSSPRTNAFKDPSTPQYHPHQVHKLTCGLSDGDSRDIEPNSSADDDKKDQ